MNKYLIIVGLFITFTSCENSSTAVSSALPAGTSEILTNALAAYEKNQSATTANNYVTVLLKEIGRKDLDDGSKKSLMEIGAQVCETNNIQSKALNFLYPLIKGYGNEPGSDDRLMKMADIMSSLKKNAGADIIYQSLINKDAAKYGAAKSKISAPIDDMDAYLKSLGEKIFENPDMQGVNKSASQNYVDACESFALANSDDANAPGYLFKAGEIARTIKTLPKVLSLYDWIITKYPDFEKTPTVLFLKGFVIENDFKNIEMAKDVYNQFLQKYPSHELADDVKFLLEHIGKSDEEILELINKK